METKRLILLALLLFGLVILSACAPEVPEVSSEEPQETRSSEDTISGEYPYPDSEEEAIHQNDLEEPYPAPQEIIANDDPYPGIGVVGSASNLDLSEAITTAEFEILSSDEDLQAGIVFINHSEIIIKESHPVQVELIIVGNLPTPCNQLRIVTSEADENGHIEVEAYTVSDPEKMCAQMLKPFTAIVPLGDYTEGTYSISINNEMSGEFKLP